jgi:omega-hydroxypalmitate O-feruloyl transferase
MAGGDMTSNGNNLPIEKLEIRVQEPELVHPAEPVEHQVYYLSNLDQNIAVPMKTVWFFNGQEDKKDQDPAAVLKEALRKLLVHMFFLAGRIGLSPDYRLQIEFEDQGLVFVEAVAEKHCIAEFGDVSRPAPFMKQLVYEPPPSENILGSPPTFVQVTKFKCGGFALGLNNNHCTLDGLAAHEFICSWGKLARGLDITHSFSIDRSMLKPRSPLQPEFSHEEFYDLEDLSTTNDSFFSINPVHGSFEVNPRDMDALKKSILDEGEGVSKVTTFEALTAFTWRVRMNSLNLTPAQKTRVFFSVDVRKKLSPPLPEHFMGNGIVLTFATTTVGELCEKPLSFAVKLVQDAIAFVTDKYVRSAIDHFEATRARPALVASFVITSWLRLPFHEADFGWGPAVAMSPASLPDQGVVLFISSGKDRKSATVILGLPTSSAMDKFGVELNKAHVN